MAALDSCNKTTLFIHMASKLQFVLDLHLDLHFAPTITYWKVNHEQINSPVVFYGRPA